MAVLVDTRGNAYVARHGYAALPVHIARSSPCCTFHAMARARQALHHEARILQNLVAHEAYSRAMTHGGLPIQGLPTSQLAQPSASRAETSAAKRVQAWWRKCIEYQRRRQASRVIIAAMRKHISLNAAKREVESIRMLRAIYDEAKQLGGAKHRHILSSPPLDARGKTSASLLRYMDQLEKVIFRVDKVSTHGSEVVRDYRRRIVQYAQALLDATDAYRTAGQQQHEQQQQTLISPPQANVHQHADRQQTQRPAQQHMGSSTQQPCSSPPTDPAASVTPSRGIPSPFAAIQIEPTPTTRDTHLMSGVHKIPNLAGQAQPTVTRRQIPVRVIGDHPVQHPHDPHQHQHPRYHQQQRQPTPPCYGQHHATPTVPARVYASSPRFGADVRDPRQQQSPVHGMRREQRRPMSEQELLARLARYHRAAPAHGRAYEPYMEYLVV